MIVSNSKMKTFQRCQFAYYNKYVLGLKKKDPAIQLKRGSWLHELLMVHYDGHDWRERQRQLTAQFNEMWEEEQEQYGDLPGETERIMKAYLMRYKREDRGLRIIDSELDELVVMPDGDQLNIIIDLIVEESDGGLWIWDHKTVKEFMAEDFMLIDAQLTRYFWAAEKMGYRPLRGVLFNELITTPPTIPTMLKSGRLTERANLRCDAFTYLHCIREHGLDPLDYRDTLLRLRAQNGRWFRRTKLPKDKPITSRMTAEMGMIIRQMKEVEARGEYPRTPMRSCRWDCDYYDPCVIALQGGEVDEVLRLKYTTRSDREEKGNG